MRRLALALAAGALVACGDGGHVEPPRAAGEEVTPVPSPRFADPELQAIATRLAEEAEERGIRSVRGRWNRVESLIALEAELGDSTLALARVNAVAMIAVRTDSGYWPSIRARELERCRRREDEGCLRADDLLERWYRHRLTIITEHLGDENRVYRYGGRHWEQYFHEFVRRIPQDAATWAWIVSRHAGAGVRASLGRNDGEAAYRYYLAMTGLGTRHEAAAVFSVPGVELGEP
jgi:hypothetical protein